MNNQNNMYFHSLQMSKQVTRPFFIRVNPCPNYISLVALIIQKAELSQRWQNISLNFCRCFSVLFISSKVIHSFHQFLFSVPIFKFIGHMQGYTVPEKNFGNVTGLYQVPLKSMQKRNLLTEFQEFTLCLYSVELSKSRLQNGFPHKFK